jgi:3-oxoacyl-[acyl-carrier protein] reductase
MSLVALVTGGSGGIGLAIVDALAAQDISVLSAGRRQQPLDRQAESARLKGHNVTPIVMDAADRASVKAALAPHPHIDILVNCAGAYSDGHFLDVSESDFESLLKANLFSVMVTSQEVAPRMPRGGRIINIASRAFLGAPRQALYASAKAAVVTLTRCMALDLSDRGISVNAISPGLIETPMTDALPPERRAAIQRMIPGGRLGRPEEIASVVALLAGSGGGYINGANILVDAGRSLGGGMAL